MRFMTFGEILAELPNVDAPDALERSKTSRALHAALVMSRPPNWWGSGVAPDQLLAIARDDGIPVVWLPRRDILEEIAAAADRPQRLAILMAREADVVEDCNELLRGCTDPWLDDEATLARAAMRAYEAGHHEAAMALAVAIDEPLAEWACTPRVKVFESRQEREEWDAQHADLSRYAWARFVYGVVTSEDVANRDVKWVALMAPVLRFFTSWWPNSGTPPPEELSRHVVVHAPTPAHFTPENALIALMLMTSILADQQEWSHEVRADDARAEFEEDD